jgi:hypothetical protein
MIFSTYCEAIQWFVIMGGVDYWINLEIPSDYKNKTFCNTRNLAFIAVYGKQALFQCSLGKIN